MPYLNTCKSHFRHVRTANFLNGGFCLVKVYTKPTGVYPDRCNFLEK